MDWAVNAARRLPEDARWILFLLLASVLLLVGPLTLSSNVTYNRWDNYEYLTPIINQVHSCLLSGQMPRVNLHQHLGEPIQSNVQAGLFYVPYTLAVAIRSALGLPLDALPAVLVALHLPLCMIGIYLLLRWLTIRPWLAAASAISISGGGFIMLHASVWLIALPNFTWIAWIVLGSMVVLEGRRTLAGGSMVAFGIPLIASIGHGQLTCYAFLYLVLVIGVGGAVCFRSILRLARLLPFVFAGVLLSAPAVLPILLFIPQTDRSSSFTRDQFFEASANPATFAGLLSPLFEISNGFMSEFKTSLFLYQGAQAVPLISAFILFGLHGLRRATAQETELTGDSRRLLHLGIVTLLVSGMFALFALGHSGVIYEWTYGIPIWSLFRWPYKFLLFTVWGLGIVSAIGGELIIRHPAVFRSTRFILPQACLAVMIAGLWWRRSELLISASGVCALGSGVVTLLLLPFIHFRWINRALVPAMLLSAIATVGLVHQIGPRTYNEPYGTYTASAFGIDPAYRAFSLGFDPRMQQCALFHMATANDYYVLSGCTQPFIPSIFTNLIPCGIDGKPSAPTWVFNALRSHFLPSLNVRYVIVAKNGLREIIAHDGDRDVEVQEYLKTTGFSPIKELEAVIVYASENALPRAYFSSQLFRWTPEAMRKGMVENESAIDAAYIPDLLSESVSFSRGQVLSEHWGRDGTVKFDIAAAEPGFLVLSLTYLPDWRAWVDEQPTPIHIVNGLVMGIEIPPGAKHVRFNYVPRGQALGLMAGVAGLVFLAMWAGGTHLLLRKRRSSTKPSAV